MLICMKLLSNAVEDHASAYYSVPFFPGYSQGPQRPAWLPQAVIPGFPDNSDTIKGDGAGKAVMSPQDCTSLASSLIA